jgi:hypothetical protein
MNGVGRGRSVSPANRLLKLSTGTVAE